MSVFFYETQIGKIGIAESEGKITNLFFATDDLPQDLEVIETPVLKEAVHQIESYIRGEREEFSLPVNPNGTPFMKEIWRELSKIPFGKTITYKQIAQSVGRPKAARAVGLACNRNPVPIIIPCHRVIGTNGSLRGYAGGLSLKRYLLQLEEDK